VQLKQALTGKSFDVQQKLLAPRAQVQAKEAVQRAPVHRTEVRNTIKDGPYEWTSAYDVGFDEAKKECNITVRVKLVPKDGNVTEEDIEGIKANVGQHFPAIWDNKFKLTDKASGKVYGLRLAVAFVENNEHLSATLNHGQGYANLSNWYAQPIGAVTPAHEFGHQLGLKDEYVDVTCPIVRTLQRQGPTPTTRSWETTCRRARARPGITQAEVRHDATSWHGDRFTSPALDRLLTRCDALVREVSNGLLPYGPL